MGATLTRTFRFRPFAVAGRLAVLLMVIAVGGCDNVEWGGIDLSIVPPPATAVDTVAPEPETSLPDGPILFYVHRDSTGATVIPVGQVAGPGLAPIAPGDDVDDFAARFIDAFLPAGQELALFRHGQRVGTLTVDSAGVPTGAVCRPLPRARGQLQLASGAGAVTEFLALFATVAPESRADQAPEPVRSMEAVSDMLAGEMLRARQLPVPSPARARSQMQPFPLPDLGDPGFTATYLVDDTLGLGDDDAGASLFVVFTPQGQTGYDTAFVGFTDYAVEGKAAPRVIDFLDWDGDGSVELLLEVFGTRTSWFRAVGADDGRWRPIFQDRCDPRTALVPADTVDAPTGADTAAPPAEARPRPPARPAPSFDSIPMIEPTIQLSNPSDNPRIRRDTSRDTVPPDTGSGG